jgi:hypothetical protein
MACRKRPDNYCQRCGKLITRKPRKRDACKYCGKPCYFAAVNAGEQQFKGRVHDGWAGFVDWAYEWESQRPKPRKVRPSKPRPLCQHCGKNPCHMRGRFCSYACNRSWRGPRVCACGKVVPDATAFGKAPYCIACKRESRRVQRRMYGSYRKRCRTYGGYFNTAVKPSSVFARDGWRCHICKKKTHRVFRVDDMRSATVDHHPIPLSKGGDHDWHNVKCACFGCNTRKSNRWDGQRRLAFR